MCPPMSVQLLHGRVGSEKRLLQLWEGHTFNRRQFKGTWICVPVLLIISRVTFSKTLALGALVALCEEWEQ